MWKKYVCMFCLSVLTLSLVACGSKLDTTGVDPKKGMDELSTGDQEKLSEALAAEVFTKKNIETSCKMAAYLQADGSGKAACEQTLATCSAAAALAEGYNANLMKQYASCKGVTVEQWTSCMKIMSQMLSELGGSLGKYSCDNPPSPLTLYTGISAELIKDYTLKCQGVLSKCGGAGGIGVPSQGTRTAP